MHPRDTVWRRCSCLQALNDPWRQQFIGGYMSEMYKALHFDKVKVKGYFCWSFYDVRQPHKHTTA